MKRKLKPSYVNSIKLEVHALFAFIDAQPDERLETLTSEQLVDAYMRERWLFKFERQEALRKCTPTPRKPQSLPSLLRQD